MKQAVGFRHILMVWMCAIMGVLTLHAIPGRADEIMHGGILVRVRKGANLFRLQAKYGVSFLKIGNTDLYRVRLPKGVDERSAAKQINNDSDVIYSEPDATVVSPVVEGQQLHYAYDANSDNTGYVNQNAYQQIKLVDLCTLPVGSGVIVAVLDTGATFNHPALVGHYLPGYNTLNPNAQPLDIPDGIDNAAVGHGTMIAGIIAKVDPAARILPIKVLNADGIGTVTNVVAGIQYAISHGAQVINMSFGATQPSDALNQAIAQAQAAGIIMVASGGNDGGDIVHYPAAISGVLGVASVEADGTKSDFSDYGSFIDLDAPGDGIRSTYWTGGYASWSGTSFAAPFVTGEVAQILDTFPYLSPSVVPLIIQSSSNSVNSLNPSYAGMLGAGVIDIYAAVNGWD